MKRIASNRIRVRCITRGKYPRWSVSWWDASGWLILRAYDSHTQALNAAITEADRRRRIHALAKSLPLAA